jgi:hypothetical protein
MSIDGIEILHSQPGQMSLGITKLKGDLAMAQEIEARFSAIQGINRVAADHHRGEVQVLYQREELTSLRSLLALKDTVAFLFPEVNPLTLAAYFSKIL